MLLKLYEFLYRKINELKMAKLLASPNYKVSLANKFTFDFILNRLIIRKNALLNLGSNVVIREYCSVLVYENAQLSLGENVFFNRYCSINCLGKISIGDNTIFGEGVRLYDHNHNFKDSDMHIRLQGYKIGSITIGNNCWIGANVVILSNVTIGDNVVIGAGNLIYKNIPSNSIVKNKAEYIIENLNL